MNDALVKELDPQLDRIAHKHVANHKPTALEPQLPFAHLVEKIHQEDITRTQTDRHKRNTNSTLSSSINNINPREKIYTVRNKILHTGSM